MITGTIFLAGITGMTAAINAALFNHADAAEPPESIVRETPSDGWWTGPLFATTASTLPQGYLDLEPFLSDAVPYGNFGPNWSTRNALQSKTTNVPATLTVEPLIEYGITDDLTAFLDPTVGLGNTGNAVGDTSVMLQHRLTTFHEHSIIPAMSLALRETFPTGQYDQLRTANGGLGAGAYQTTVALNSQYYFWDFRGRLLRTRFDLSYSFADRPVDLRGISVYGTRAGFSGVVRPADSFTINTSLEYSLTQKLVPALDIIYTHDASTRISGTALIPSAFAALINTVRTRSSSSDAVTLAPALEMSWSRTGGIIIGVADTFAGRNINATVTPIVAVNFFLH